MEAARAELEKVTYEDSSGRVRKYVGGYHDQAREVLRLASVAATGRTRTRAHPAGGRDMEVGDLRRGERDDAIGAGTCAELGRRALGFSIAETDAARAFLSML